MSVCKTCMKFKLYVKECPCERYFEYIIVNKNLEDVVKEYEGILKQHKDYFRKYFLSHPVDALIFAQHIDERPREDTRDACCKSYLIGYLYAKTVDKQPHNDTRAAAYKDSYAKEKYKQWEQQWRFNNAH